MIDSLEPIKTLGTLDNLVFFIDIDDTIITPMSNCFHYGSPGYNLIDDMKKNPPENFSEILSNWRMSRKIQLVDDQWVELIKSLRNTNKVYALTQMHSGKFGDIESMEEWRHSELKNLGIIFTENFNELDHSIILKGKDYDAIFYKGIFVTGDLTKGQIIDEYLKYHQPSKIVFIDDRQSHVNDVKDICEKNNIVCISYLYRGMENLLYKNTIEANEIIEFQRDQLINHSKWFEDEEAVNELINNC